jgi:hypothetical protein
MRTWRDDQVAWAAGFIDGDGSIVWDVVKRNGVSYGNRRVRLQGYENHPEVLQRLVDVFGGAIYGPIFNKSHKVDGYKRKPQYQWMLRGPEAVDALKDMMVYFGPVRLAQAETVIILWEDARSPTAVGRPVRSYRKAA